MSAPHTLNKSWTHPLYAPDGLATSDPHGFSLQYEEWLRLSPALADARPFMWTESLGIDDFKHHVSSQGVTHINSSFFRLIHLDIKGGNGVEGTQAILNQSPLKYKAKLHVHKFSFPREASFSKASAVRARDMLTDLDDNVRVAFNYYVLTFVVCSLWLVGLWHVKVISIFVYVLTILEIYWMSAYLVEFNAVSVVGLALALSHCPPFVSHLANVYALQSGAPDDRLDWSMGYVIPALRQGCITVLLLMFPLLLSPWPFMQKYFLLPLALSLLVSLINGCVVLPGLLASCNRYLAGESVHARRQEKFRLMMWQKPGSHLMRLRQHSNSRRKSNAPVLEAVRSVKLQTSLSTRRTCEGQQASVAEADVLPSLLTEEPMNDKVSGKNEV
jgi:hypothetical protein